MVVVKTSLGAGLSDGVGGSKVKVPEVVICPDGDTVTGGQTANQVTHI